MRKVRKSKSGSRFISLLLAVMLVLTSGPLLSIYAENDSTTQQSPGGDTDLLSSGVTSIAHNNTGNGNVVFMLEVNKLNANLKSYELMPTFSGDVNNITTAKVYMLATGGSKTLAVAGGDYEYEDTTGKIIFADPAKAYVVEYYVELNVKWETDAPFVKGEFNGIYSPDGSATLNATSERVFEPMNVSNLDNKTIITDYDLHSENHQDTLLLYWQLYDLIGESQQESVTVPDYHGGSYFVFKLNPAQIEIHNDTFGKLSLLDKSDIVGSYYITKEGYVILILDTYAEQVEEIKGKLSITSTIVKEDDNSFELDLDINGETNIGKGNKDYGLSKYGELTVGENGHSAIAWTILVNTEGDTLKNLVLKDDVVYQANVYYAFNFTNDIEIFEAEYNDSKEEWEPAGGPLAETEYSATLSVLRNWTIRINGDENGETDKTYIIKLQGESGETAWGGGERKFRNRVKSTDDNFPQLEATATVSRNFSKITKKGSNSTSADGKTGIADWELTYETTGPAKSSDIVLTDTINKAEWVPTSNPPRYLDFKEYPHANTSPDALVKNLQAIYTPNDNTAPVQAACEIVSIEAVQANSSGALIDIGYTFKIKLSDSFTSQYENIEGKMTFTYKTETDLTSSPGHTEGARGWRIKNTVVTQDNGSSSVTPFSSYIEKNSVSLNYETAVAAWSIKISGSKKEIKDGAVLYDVLPNGFTLIPGSITVYDGNRLLDVVSTDQGYTGTEYFVLDQTARDLTLAMPIQYENNRGFALTFRAANNSGSSDKDYTIRFQTTYNYDPEKIGTGDNNEGYVDSYKPINFAHLVYGTEYASDSANVTIFKALDDNGSKSGSYHPKAANDLVVNENIKWTVYANALNKDISGYTFDDELQPGRQSSDANATVVQNSEQTVTLNDVKVYPYKIARVSSNTNAQYDLDLSTTVLDSYLKDNGFLTVEDNTVKIEFPDDYKDKFRSGEALAELTSMRFAIIITSTLENKTAPYYPNTAVLKKGDKKSAWSAGVSVDHIIKSVEKKGIIAEDSKSVNYSIIFNKDQYLVKNLLVEDSLMYDDEGNQLVYLMSDEENPIRYDLRVYTAKVTIGNGEELIYTKDRDITADCTLTYEPGNPDKQGFKLAFSNDLEINTPLIMEYACGLELNYLGTENTLKNTVKITGTATSEDHWAAEYKHTSSEGAFSGVNVDIAIRKVNEQGEPVTGASFIFYNNTKSWQVKSGTVDSNGILSIKDIVTGTYYLVETPPAGFYSPFAFVKEALLVVITKDTNSGIVSVIIGEGASAKTYTSDGEKPAEAEIENREITGSFLLKKYANDIEGNKTSHRLAGAEFIMYKEEIEKDADTGTSELVTYYYSGEDPNGVCVFETKDIDRAVVMSTDENGILNQERIISGTYYLKETKAPLGYKVLDEPFKIEVPSEAALDLEVYDDMDLIDISGTKTWLDEGYEEKRPDSIAVKLFRETANLAEKQFIVRIEVASDANNNWNYTFHNLPKLDSDGNEYIYTVEEERIAGYTPVIDGYNITNVYKAVSNERSNESSSNTKNGGLKTGDTQAVLIWIMLVIIAAGAVVTLMIARKKKSRKY